MVCNPHVKKIERETAFVGLPLSLHPFDMMAVSLFRNSQYGGNLVAGLWKCNGEAFGCLTGLELAVAKEIDTRDRLLEIGISLGKRLDGELSVLRPA